VLRLIEFLFIGSLGFCVAGLLGLAVSGLRSPAGWWGWSRAWDLPQRRSHAVFRLSAALRDRV